MSNILKIALAEDKKYLQDALLEKLSFFKGIKVKHIANDGAELLEQLQNDSNVDLILMDIEMPNLDGIAATKEIKQKYPQIKVLMITVFDDDEAIFNAILAGANGYLLKDTSPDKLHQSILDVMEGGASMSPSIALKALNLLKQAPVEVKNQEGLEVELSNRELEILVQLQQGLTYTQIAENLIIAPSTVRKHLENIYKKLQVHNKIEAVNKAKTHGII